MPFKGTCLCGQTTVTVNSDHDHQVVCHCWDCKQTSGSAFSTNVLAPKKDVKIEGPIKTYEAPAASGNPVGRIFCGVCGSAISHTSKAFGDAQAIQTGNFREFASVPFGAELFTKDRFEGLAAIEGAAQAKTMPEH